MNSKIKSITLRLITSIVLILPFLLNGQKTNLKYKIKGMSYVGPEHSKALDASFISMQELNISWIGIIPEVILNRNTLKLRSDGDNHWWGARKEGSVEAIKTAKSQGHSVMLKPQVIMDKVQYNHGPFSNKATLINLGNKEIEDNTGKASWRGDFNPKSNKKWEIWETSYTAYILELARVAESHAVDLFCIGTELKASTKHRPQFWKKLIEEVRKVYSGPITYSANWDEYERITFWEDLDYIGMNAYFPISYFPTPSILKTTKNWKYIAKKMKTISDKYGKQILITEYGYRNVSFAGMMPWTHDDDSSKSNPRAQANLYESFYKGLWDYKWIAGGFAWNWEEDLKDSSNTDFSIREKLAEGVLSRWYRKTISSDPLAMGD